MIPQRLVELEVPHRGLTELHVVQTMHERKSMMAALSDGVISLPGGIGTLDELFELFTWSQLGLHRKPLGVLDVAGYWGPLLALIDHLVDEGFLRAAHRDTLLVDADAPTLLDRIGSYRTPATTSGPTALPSGSTPASAGAALGAEHPIAGVAQPGPDVGALVELAVDGGGPDLDVGVRLLHRRTPSGAATRHTSSSCLAPARLRWASARIALPPVASIGSSTYTRAVREPGRQTLVVVDGFVRLVVAIHRRGGRRAHSAAGAGSPRPSRAPRAAPARP